MLVTDERYGKTPIQRMLHFTPKMTLILPAKHLIGATYTLKQRLN